MWSIGWDVCKKWLFFFNGIFYKIFSLIKENISAITLKFFMCAIVPIGIVKIVVSPIVRDRTNVL